ncbi:cytochrome C [Hyphomicrobium nitrativorans NL23]|uniref:Cytochrome C n=1 Tax=Hyphomicrobium nitrativorans NL23 TaxID=1029756 RepID=V5SBS7_9HYPH|nr:cytochrome c [Hyphomicrobium nitrativorans]AHB48326.1 cytochrome C [Hyphomicrobium nitrativorans NL23]
MRISASLRILCIAMAAAAAGCGEATPDDPGKAVLESRCARCHGIGETDASAHAEAPPFRDVVKRYPPESLAEALAEGITTGHPDMPEFVLAPAEIGAVIDYLTTLTPNRS